MLAPKETRATSQPPRSLSSDAPIKVPSKASSFPSACSIALATVSIDFSDVLVAYENTSMSAEFS
ncbi:hypothetical protein [Natranaerobius trueperi]|uniref:Uncharacterized protein n=1 Tax=Natranaerobius trueperi TaxID=759412 RepID=A0A226C0J1_9FIRM|nr:hypothetical protein [Natranaerobius trueperi]OWZ84773.1 hypothetical protein CDO51_01775 [Natranaerobius trueperi]